MPAVVLHGLAMRASIAVLSLGFVLVDQPAAAEPEPNPEKQGVSCPTRVRVNRDCVPAARLAQLGLQRTPPGSYWYDARAGIAGRMGGPVLRQVPPGLPLPGPMPADASVQWSKVFVNGRALHPTELRMLREAFGYVRPGRYWLNADGNAGLEGSPQVMVNLLRRPRGGDGSWSYSENSGTSRSFVAGGSPGCVWASTKDTTVMSGCD
jgi:hypothetical protein